MTKPPLAVPSLNGGRVYRHPLKGTEVLSVTTILDGGIPKPLEGWYARVAARYAVEHWEELSLLPPDERVERIRLAPDHARDKAADKGDVVHESVESALKGAPDGNSPTHLDQFRDFLAVSGLTPVYQEVTVWSHRYGYAGTADLIARNKRDRYVLVDYKTGGRIYPEAAIQVEALARCEVIVYPDGQEEPLPLINHVGVLHLRPKSWWYHPVETGVRTGNWHTFLSAKEITEWRRFHPSLVWGDEGRWNAETWPGAAEPSQVSPV